MRVLFPPQTNRLERWSFLRLEDWKNSQPRVRWLMTQARRDPRQKEKATTARSLFSEIAI